MAYSARSSGPRSELWVAVPPVATFGVISEVVPVCGEELNNTTPDELLLLIYQILAWLSIISLLGYCEIIIISNSTKGNNTGKSLSKSKESLR